MYKIIKILEKEYMLLFYRFQTSYQRTAYLRGPVKEGGGGGISFPYAWNSGGGYPLSLKLPSLLLFYYP